METRKPEVLIAHGWSDRNRGDAAIVRCLSDLVLHRFPSARPWLMSEFSASDWRFQHDYFDSQDIFPETILGSVFPIVPIQRGSQELSHVNRDCPVRDRWTSALLATFYFARSLCVAFGIPLPFWLWSADEQETLSAVSRADLVLSKGGGFLFGERSLRSTLRLWRTLFPFVLARRSGTPFVLYGQSIGPFATTFQTWVARKVLNYAALILVRERLSAELLNRIQVRAPVAVVPDLAFALPSAPKDEVDHLLKKYGLPRGRPLVGITVRDWHSVRGAYRASIRVALERLLQNTPAHVVIWPHCTGPGDFEDDRRASCALARSLCNYTRLTLIQEEISPQLLKACYGRMEMMIATRFHSAIFALSELVPTIVIGYWGPKAEGIMEELGLQKWVYRMQALNASDLAKAVLSLWVQRQDIRRHLRNRIPTVVNRTRQLHPQVVRLLERVVVPTLDSRTV